MEHREFLAHCRERRASLIRQREAIDREIAALDVFLNPSGRTNGTTPNGRKIPDHIRNSEEVAAVKAKIIEELSRQPGWIGVSELQRLVQPGFKGGGSFYKWVRDLHKQELLLLDESIQPYRVCAP